MSKIIAVGDSFTYGEELQDRNLCFSNLVAESLGFSLLNLGLPGGSNWRSVRLLMNENLQDCKLVLIGWSYYQRFEIADELGIFCSWPGGKRTKFRNQADWRKNIIDHYSRHYNDDFLYTHYLMQIVFVQNYLQNNRIPFIMMDAFGNNLDSRRSSSEFSVLTEQVDPATFIGWPETSMMDWAKDVPYGPGNHFLEDGHRIVANKILQRVHTLYEL